MNRYSRLEWLRTYNIIVKNEKVLKIISNDARRQKKKKKKHRTRWSTRITKHEVGIYILSCIALRLFSTPPRDAGPARSREPSAEMRRGNGFPTSFSHLRRDAGKINDFSNGRIIVIIRQTELSMPPPPPPFHV